METELYSVADIARMLNVPESTVRYYREHFAAYIPVVGKGRTRKYPVDAMEVFTLIAAKLKAGMKRSDIETMLEKFPTSEGKSGINSDITAIRDELESLHSELKGKFEEIAASAEPHRISDLLTLSDFTEGLEGRFGIVFNEIDELKEQFNFIVGEFAAANKKLDEIYKSIQNQRDRDVTGALRKEKPHGWFKR